MPTFLIALASALVLAPLITEASQRFWPDNYVALLIIAFVALLVNGLFNARLRQSQATPAKPVATPKSRDERPQRQSEKSNNKPQPKARNNRGDRPQRDKNQQSEKSKPSAASAPDNAPAGPQETGTVKWFNRSKGYGFIIRDNGDEVFVHQRSIVTEGDNRQRPVLRDGQKVSFVVAHLDKGAQAEKVTGLD